MPSIRTVREPLLIDPRFAGPPGRGNGGYCCGLIAGLVGGPAEVALRQALPLATPLDVDLLEDGSVVVHRDEAQVIAEAHPARFDAEIPEPVTPEQAAAAAAGFPWLEGHPFPGCFVCGTGREPGDGLRLFAGPIAGRSLVAAPLVVDDASLADGGGAMLPEIVWAALGCPGGAALAAAGALDGPSILSRLSANVIESPRVGERHVVVAWPVRAELDEAVAGSAIFSDMGELRAVARATWMRVG